MSPWSHEKFSRPIIKKQFRDAVNEFPLLQGKKLQSACSLFHLQIMVDFKCLPKRRVIWFTILSIFFWIHFFPKTKTKPPPIKLMTGHFLKPSIPQAPNSCERRIICERPKKRMKTMWKRVTRNLSKINLSMMWSKKAVFNVYTHIFIHIYIYKHFIKDFNQRCPKNDTKNLPRLLDWWFRSTSTWPWIQTSWSHTVVWRLVTNKIW